MPRLCPVCDRPIGVPGWRIPLWAPLVVRLNHALPEPGTAALTPVAETCSRWCGEILAIAHAHMMTTDPAFWTARASCVQKVAVPYLPPVGGAGWGELLLPCEAIGQHTLHVAHFSNRTFTWLA